VMDEPNSNLDTAGDKALARAMAHAKRSGITVVVVTQKASLLNHVDNIMMLADGQIAMFGSRDRMLKALAERGGVSPGVIQGGTQQQGTGGPPPGAMPPANPA